MDERKRPGEPLKEKATSQDSEGNFLNQFEEKMDKDEVYAEAFWQSKRLKGEDEKFIAKQIENYKEIIIKQAPSGMIGIFVNKDGITEDDKMKLSAIRILASSIGYKIGPYKFNENSGGVTATLEKK